MLTNTVIKEQLDCTIRHEADRLAASCLPEKIMCPQPFQVRAVALTLGLKQVEALCCEEFIEMLKQVKG